LQLFESFFSTIFRHEFHGSSRFENGASSLHDIGNGIGMHPFDITFNHALVSSVDAIEFKAVEDSCSHHGADAGIHSGRITT
jgi:hypothetical protein